MWNISRALQIPLDEKIKELRDIPYTLSFIIRKRTQIDNFSELPKDKRPDDHLVWEGTIEDLENWFDRVLKGKASREVELVIDPREVEG